VARVGEYLRGADTVGKACQDRQDCIEDSNGIELDGLILDEWECQRNCDTSSIGAGMFGGLFVTPPPCASAFPARAILDAALYHHGHANDPGVTPALPLRDRAT